MASAAPVSIANYRTDAAAARQTPRAVVGLGRSSGLRNAGRSGKCNVGHQFASYGPSLKTSGASSMALRSTNLVEVVQLAEVDPIYVWGVAGIMFAITLVGLAIGFVLLRVESLVEEGKIKM